MRLRPYLSKASTLDLGVPTPWTPILPTLRHQPQGLWPYLSRWIRWKDCPPSLSLASFLARPSSSTSPFCFSQTFGFIFFRWTFQLHLLSLDLSTSSSSVGPFGFIFFRWTFRLPFSSAEPFNVLLSTTPLASSVSLASFFFSFLRLTQNWSILTHFYTSFTNDQRTRILESKLYIKNIYQRFFYP